MRAGHFPVSPLSGGSRARSSESESSAPRRCSPRQSPLRLALGQIRSSRSNSRETQSCNTSPMNRPADSPLAQRSATSPQPSAGGCSQSSRHSRLGDGATPTSASLLSRRNRSPLMTVNCSVGIVGLVDALNSPRSPPRASAVGVVGFGRRGSGHSVRSNRRRFNRVIDPDGAAHRCRGSALGCASPSDSDTSLCFVLSPDLTATRAQEDNASHVEISPMLSALGQPALEAGTLSRLPSAEVGPRNSRGTTSVPDRGLLSVDNSLDELQDTLRRACSSGGRRSEDNEHSSGMNQRRGERRRSKVTSTGQSTASEDGDSDSAASMGTAAERATFTHNSGFEVWADSRGGLRRVRCGGAEPAEYRIVGNIASGTTGVVYKVRDAEGKLLALKEVPLLKKGLAEEKHLQSANGIPNVVRFHRALQCEGHDLCYLLFDYIEGGPLCRIDAEGTLVGPRWTESKARRAFYELAHTLCDLHAVDIVHRDIKPDNVLLDRAGKVHLIDFGESNQLKTGNDMTRKTKGTPFFLPPEVFEGDTVMAKHVDVWGLGVMLHLLLVGRVPYGQGCTNFMALSQRMSTDELDLSGDGLELSADVVNLLEGILEKDITRRLGTAREICDHPWLTGSTYPLPVVRTPQQTPRSPTAMVSGSYAHTGQSQAMDKGFSFASALSQHGPSRGTEHADTPTLRPSVGMGVLPCHAPLSIQVTGPAALPPAVPPCSLAPGSPPTPCGPIPHGSPQLIFPRSHHAGVAPTGGPRKLHAVRKRGSTPRLGPRSASASEVQGSGEGGSGSLIRHLRTAHSCRALPACGPLSAALGVACAAPTGPSHPLEENSTLQVSKRAESDHESDEPPPRKILIVDDTYQHRHVIGKIIKHMVSAEDRDCIIYECWNGVEAVQAMKDTRYTLVFMDIHMPYMSGLEATQNIRQFEMENKLELTPIIGVAQQHAQGGGDAAQALPWLTVDSGMHNLVDKPIPALVMKELLEWAKVPVKPGSWLEIEKIFDNKNAWDKACKKRINDESAGAYFPLTPLLGTPPATPMSPGNSEMWTGSWCTPSQRMRTGESAELSPTAARRRSRHQETGGAAVPMSPVMRLLAAGTETASRGHGPLLAASMAAMLDPGGDSKASGDSPAPAAPPELPGRQGPVAGGGTPD
eukprot:TRINITY_DN9154_c0_g1_i1.p1 TRINITY_DN9154_c0_g1~~TRINITY_DN9154_c0_g1_i1.p1  ORF type:complete len:1173 (+),score=208.63 TRINITY_DN9154_c0_g1_i1:79-3519(+)